MSHKRQQIIEGIQNFDYGDASYLSTFSVESYKIWKSNPVLNFGP